MIILFHFLDLCNALDAAGFLLCPHSCSSMLPLHGLSEKDLGLVPSGGNEDIELY